VRHKLLADYLAAVEPAVSQMTKVYVEHYTEEILAPERANLCIRIRLVDGGLLEINEAVVVESGVLVWLGYRYHCQDAQNRLIFRYDNTPHFPELPSFPHHKHLPDSVIATEKPTVLHVIGECREPAP